MRSSPACPAWIGRLAAGPVAGAVMVSSSPAPATTFGDVVASCWSPPEAGDDKLCGAYLTGALALLRTPDLVLNGSHRICYPESDPARVIIPLIPSWSRKHPGQRDDDLVPAVGGALVGRYPCP